MRKTFRGAERNAARLATDQEKSTFSHIVVGADDLSSARRFYDAALGAIGLAPGVETGERVIYSADTGILMVTKPIDGKPASFGNGVTIGLNAPNVAAVDAFHAQGLRAGEATPARPGPVMRSRFPTRPICVIPPETS